MQNVSFRNIGSKVKTDVRRSCHNQWSLLILVCPRQDALPVGNGLAKPGPVLFPQDALRLQQESSGSGAGAVVATVGCSVLGMMLAGGIWFLAVSDGKLILFCRKVCLHLPSPSQGRNPGVHSWRSTILRLWFCTTIIHPWNQSYNIIHKYIINIKYPQCSPILSWHGTGPVGAVIGGTLAIAATAGTAACPDGAEHFQHQHVKGSGDGR